MCVCVCVRAHAIVGTKPRDQAAVMYPMQVTVSMCEGLKPREEDLGQCLINNRLQPQLLLLQAGRF